MRKRIEVLSYEKIKEKLNLITDVRDKALCAVLYSSAGRINEVLSLTKTNFKRETNFLLITISTEKHPLHPSKIIPVPLLKENWLVEPILNYLTICPEKLFDFTDRTARKITHKWIGCHPHHLRHCRLTHLVSVYNCNSNRLRLIAGWSDDRPAVVYTHLNWMDTKTIFE